MITASIVAYKTSETDLRKVLNCVCQSIVSTIYIVDNSPTDCLKSFEKKSPKIKYIFGQGNIGYGAAHNIAIRKSIEQGATYHVVINPDIYFENGTIEKLTQYMNENSDVGQVMPKIIYPNGELQYLCKLLPTPMDLIGRRFIPIKSYVERHNYRFELRASGYNKEMNVPFLSGCFMFLRVQSLKEVGLFDQRYFMYAEDVDLIRRIHSKYRTMFFPDCIVTHAHAAASYKDKKMLKIHIVNIIKYFNKWGWLFDAERRKMNRELLLELNYKKK